jgi:hypothetical protein
MLTTAIFSPGRTMSRSRLVQSGVLALDNRFKPGLSPASRHLGQYADNI